MKKSSKKNFKILANTYECKLQSPLTLYKGEGGEGGYQNFLVYDDKAVRKGFLKTEMPRGFKGTSDENKKKKKKDLRNTRFCTKNAHGALIIFKNFTFFVPHKDERKKKMNEEKKKKQRDFYFDSIHTRDHIASCICVQKKK